MNTWKDGDRVRIIDRPVTAEDRKSNRYYGHMSGLVGVVQSVYSEKEIAVKVDPSSMSTVTADVHQIATGRMRAKFVGSVSEEQKKVLTKEEMDFDVNYVLLVQSSDLEAA